MEIDKLTMPLLYVAVFAVASYLSNPVYALIAVFAFHVGHKKSIEKEKEVLNNANDKN